MKEKFASAIPYILPVFCALAALIQIQLIRTCVMTAVCLLSWTDYALNPFSDHPVFTKKLFAGISTFVMVVCWIYVLFPPFKVY